MTGTNEPSSPNTKARILHLLRRGEHSVLEVSEHLGLARNTVRTHISDLERERMVERTGVRRSPGAGKPAYLFQLTDDARARFSNAYIPFLQTLIETLAERLDEDEFIDLMHEMGRRLAPEPATPDTPPPDRLATTVGVLNALGATLTAARTNGTTVIEGASCPLGAVVANRPLVCRAIQIMLSRMLGVELVTNCRYDGVPACRFDGPPGHNMRDGTLRTG